LGQKLELGLAMVPAEDVIVRTRRKPISHKREALGTYKYLQDKAVLLLDPLQMGAELGRKPFRNSYLQNLRA
jgi:hypothetical protein